MRFARGQGTLGVVGAVVLGLAGVGTSASAATSATAVKSSAAVTRSDDEQRTHVTVDIQGKDTFVRNDYFKSSFRFGKDEVSVKHGGTITWHNESMDGHTISLVARSDEPKDFNCPVCDAVNGALFPQNGPPNFVLDGGVAGDDDSMADADTHPDFDTISHTNGAAAPTLGDAMLVDASGANNHGGPTDVTALVTAPAGTTLEYMCTFHPWMQAQIKVR